MYESNPKIPSNNNIYKRPQYFKLFMPAIMMCNNFMFLEISCLMYSTIVITLNSPLSFKESFFSFIFSLCCAWWIKVIKTMNSLCYCCAWLRNVLRIVKCAMLCPRWCDNSLLNCCLPFPPFFKRLEAYIMDSWHSSCDLV